MEVTNRVAQSELETFNLEALWDESEVVELDLAPFLVEGLMLKEKPFREDVKAHDWQQYDDQHVAIYCSTDAIVPTWAFMLVASRLHGIAASVAFGREADLVHDYFTRTLETHDWSQYDGKPVVIKGCGSGLVPTSAYLTATQKLQQHARKIMFGEACSSVPLWRRPQEHSPKKEAVGTKSVSADLPSPGA